MAGPYTPFVPYPPQFQDSASANLSGGTLEFFLAGTSTPTNIYSDDAGTSLGTSVTLDASGYPSSGGAVVTLFRDTTVDLKVVLRDAASVIVWTSDDHDQPLATMFDIVDSGSEFPNSTTIEDALLEARGQLKAATAADTRTSDTTYSDDNHLAGWTLDTGGHYAFEFFIPYNQNVGDIKVRLQFSNAVSPEYGIFHAADVNGATTAISYFDPTSGLAVTTMTDNVIAVLYAAGSFQANATTGGTLDLQWAQSTSSANVTTANEGRWMRVQRIA